MSSSNVVGPKRRNPNEFWEMPNGPVVCECNTVAPMREAWKKNTSHPGRRFLGCSRYNKANGCNFFQWCDSSFTERSKDVILHLKEELRKNDEMLRLTMEVFNVTPEDGLAVMNSGSEWKKLTEENEALKRKLKKL